MSSGVTGQGFSLDSFFSTLSRIGPMRLAALLGITAGITLALVMMAANMGKADKALLYNDLDLKEAGQISAELDRMGVDYDIRAGGTAVFVDRNKVQQAKMALAEENLPTSGSIGYDVFDRNTSMGQTAFTQNINKLRALQGELERTISSLDGVSAARVLLVLPERQLFQTEKETAKASVTIKLNGNALGTRQTNAIRFLVAGAVPGLKASAVTIVDDSGRVLAGGLDEDGQMGVDPLDARMNVEQALRQKIIGVLSSVVGPENVEVQVHADLDMNRITEHEIKYDPDGQVLISSDTSEQNSDEKDSDKNGSVSVSENVPGGDADKSNAAGNSSVTASSHQTKNFGVSKTETTTIVPPGAIERLSVAVNVDGQRTTDADGNTNWSARTPEEMNQITALVKSAMGYDAARKDQVEVTNLRFSRPAPIDLEGAASAPGFDKNDIMRMAELGIMGIVSIVMIFFLGRPLLTALLSGGGPVVGGASPVAVGASATGGAMPQLPGAESADMQMALPSPGGAMPGVEDGLDVSKIEGQVRASSVKKVAGIVESHPEESMSILRNWLHEA